MLFSFTYLILSRQTTRLQTPISHKSDHFTIDPFSYLNFNKIAEEKIYNYTITSL